MVGNGVDTGATDAKTISISPLLESDYLRRLTKPSIPNAKDIQAKSLAEIEEQLNGFPIPHLHSPIKYSDAQTAVENSPTTLLH